MVGGVSIPELDGWSTGPMEVLKAHMVGPCRLTLS